MCIYKLQTENERCKNIRNVQTPNTRTKILKLHNEYRNKLAGGNITHWPKAANMMEMSWDYEMESVALRWAVQCKDEYHDKCRRIPRYKTLGQNYAAQLGDPEYMADSVESNFESWVEEISLISRPLDMINRFKGGRWSHFSQVIWAESFLVGCASVHYEKDHWKNSADYCNYGPPGNVVAFRMYEVGEPASKCPVGTSRSNQYRNLCANPKSVANSTSAPSAGYGNYVTSAAVEGTTKCGKNSKCKGRTITDKCSDIVDVQTPDARVAMLNLHNEYRNKIAGGEMKGWPKAANMREMSWDDEVESVALRWALQCVDGHDKCRSTPQFPSVGQNYAAQMGSNEYQEGSNKMNFDGWVGEITLIADPKAMLSRFQGGNWGHFTQVVWAKSYKLGCGSVHFVQDNWKTSVDICNYAPSGNVQSLPMYEEGDPASKCPTGTSQSKQYPNLCAGSQTVSNAQPSVPRAVESTDGGTSASAPINGSNIGGSNHPGNVSESSLRSGIGRANEGFIRVIQINPNREELKDPVTEEVSCNGSDKNHSKPDNRSTGKEDVHDSNPKNQSSCPAHQSEKHHKHEPCRTLEPTKQPKHKHDRKSAAALSELNSSLTLLIIFILGTLKKHYTDV
ncbi:hypothetical protein GE061_005323 [Apolygus lucorum]|uniref:SCP domain-containing protein n=1 Tax=Apolygus lucorum TaxID=248454 RepID=A0A6A4IVN8_APOLU|nr:hypothetical protein GE061_005323 [Apolygus lucorum]